MGYLFQLVCRSFQKALRFQNNFMERFTAKGSWKTEDMRLPDRKGNGTPLQHSCLENPMDGGAWWVAVHGVAKSCTRLSGFTFTLHFPALEKEMAAHSSVLVWRIPGTGEPRGLTSLGSHRVGHDWSDLAATMKMSTLSYVSWSLRYPFLVYKVSSIQALSTVFY